MKSEIIAVREITMEYDNMQITTYQELNKSSAPTRMFVNGTRCDMAGTMDGDNVVRCGECSVRVIEPSDITDPDTDVAIIRESGEADYMSLRCEECNQFIDTYVLVYKHQDPDLWHQIVWSSQVREKCSDGVTTDDRNLCKTAKKAAYRLGWEDAKVIEDTVNPHSDPPECMEPPTDSARWANITAPRLRAIAGYLDEGHGTYQTVFRDVSYDCLNEDVLPAYRRAYHDRATGNEPELSV